MASVLESKRTPEQHQLLRAVLVAQTDRILLENLREWVGDRAALERKDPYLCSATANGTKHL
jgi:hypothetical protein